jgi:hypothetical protein
MWLTTPSRLRFGKSMKWCSTMALILSRSTRIKFRSSLLARA